MSRAAELLTNTTSSSHWPAAESIMNEWPRCGGSNRPTISPVGAFTASPRARPAPRPWSAAQTSAAQTSTCPDVGGPDVGGGTSATRRARSITQSHPASTGSCAASAHSPSSAADACATSARATPSPTPDTTARACSRRSAAASRSPVCHTAAAAAICGVGAVEVRRPVVGPHGVGVGDRGNEVARERRRDRMDGRAVRHVGANIEQHGQRLLGPAGLAQPERQRGTYLGPVAAHRRELDEGRLADHHRPLAEAQMDGTARGHHRREGEVTEARRRATSPPRSPVRLRRVRPSAISERTRGASAWTMPNRSPSSRNECNARRDSSSDSLKRPDQRRIEASSESIIAGAQRSPSSSASARTLRGEQLGVGEAPLEEPDVGEQAVRPATPGAVPQLLELLGGEVEPGLRHLQITGQERHPGLVLSHPGASATVVQPLGETLRLAEQPFGIAQRAAEHFDESPFAQRRGEFDVVTQLTEQFDARAQFGAGRIEVARRAARACRAAGGRGPRGGGSSPMSAAASAASGVDARRGRPHAVRSPPRHATSRSSRAMTGSDGHRSRARPAWRWAWLNAPDVEGTLRGGEEQARPPVR